MAEIAESETDNQPDLRDGPHSNSHFLIQNGEEKPMELDNETISMDTDNNMIDNKITSAGPDGDSMETTSNGPKYDDIKISKDGDNFVNIDTVKKPFSDFIHLDNMSATSGDSGGKHDTISNASMTASGTSSSKSPNHKPDKEKGQILVSAGRSHAIQNGRVVDHVKKDKEKEREDRIRQQREKLLEERQKKMEEMKEQQRLAQEKRDRQLELRRLKIEELKRRDGDRRNAVDERRRRQETEEMARRESIIQKSQERITRFEQWKASGRKGHFGGGAPPNKHLSMSTSALYNKRSSDFNGSTGNLSLKDRPGSLLALNAISEKRRSFLAGNGPPPTRPRSSVNLASKENVKLRERSTPRKPRPSSVATSMPSFMHVESPSPKMRSKSTDRIAKDKQKGPIPPQPKFTPKKEKEALNKQEKSNDKKEERKKFDPRKLLAEKRKAEQEKKAEEAKKEGTPEKTGIKISQKSIDRLSAPKQVKEKTDTPTKPEPAKISNVRKSPAAYRTKSPPKKVKPIKQRGKENKETPPKDTMTEAPSIDDKSEKVSSTEKLDTDTKPLTPTKQNKNKDGSPAKLTVSFDSSIMSSTDAAEQLFESIEDETLPDMGDSSPGNSESSGKEVKKADNMDDSINKDIDEIEDTEIVAGNIEVEGVIAKSQSPIPDVIPQVEKDDKADETQDALSTITVPETPLKSEPVVTSTPAKEVSDLSASTKTSTPASASKSQKELELEEYRAKLAEKRRQAREKAEKEAELERQRQEQLRLEDEERQEREEEEQKRIEEEAERLAEEARRIEGERLRKAIEAEEQRKREEAERAEQERLAREEAERKQKEEVERLEKEKVEKIKREEEERNERKKKLAAIMSKVKSDKNLAGSDSNLSLSSLASSQSLTNLATSEDEQTEDQLQVQDSTPKFKSPLLQKLVENKQNGGGSETPKFKSPLLQSLLGKKGRLTDKLDTEKSDKCDTKPPSEEREVTESDNSDSDNSVINTDEHTLNNGLHNGDTTHITEMVDSSISMRTVDSLATSVTDSSLYGSLTESASTADHKFEQIIDLNVTNAKYNTTDDLLNCNTNISFDNQGEETLPKPIIAFEDNATRRQEVADFL